MGGMTVRLVGCAALAVVLTTLCFSWHVSREQSDVLLDKDTASAISSKAMQATIKKAVESAVAEFLLHSTNAVSRAAAFASPKENRRGATFHGGSEPDEYKSEMSHITDELKNQLSSSVSNVDAAPAPVSHAVAERDADKWAKYYPKDERVEDFKAAQDLKALLHNHKQQSGFATAIAREEAALSRNPEYLHPHRRHAHKAAVKDAVTAPVAHAAQPVAARPAVASASAAAPAAPAAAAVAAAVPAAVRAPRAAAAAPSALARQLTIQEKLCIASPHCNPSIYAADPAPSAVKVERHLMAPKLSGVASQAAAVPAAAAAASAAAPKAVVRTPPSAAAVAPAGGLGAKKPVIPVSSSRNPVYVKSEEARTEIADLLLKRLDAAKAAKRAQSALPHVKFHPRYVSREELSLDSAAEVDLSKLKKQLAAHGAKLPAHPSFPSAHKAPTTPVTSRKYPARVKAESARTALADRDLAQLDRSLKASHPAAAAAAAAPAAAADTKAPIIPVSSRKNPVHIKAEAHRDTQADRDLSELEKQLKAQHKTLPAAPHHKLAVDVPITSRHNPIHVKAEAQRTAIADKYLSELEKKLAAHGKALPVLHDSDTHHSAAAAAGSATGTLPVHESAEDALAQRDLDALKHHPAAAGKA